MVIEVIVLNTGGEKCNLYHLQEVLAVKHNICRQIHLPNLNTRIPNTLTIIGLLLGVIDGSTINRCKPL